MRQYFQQRKFALDLKRFREKYDLSQFDCAVLAGCTPGHISVLESGKLSDHKMDSILRICDLMEIDFRNYISDMEVKKAEYHD